MKVRFKEAPKGRDFKVGQVVEFKGAVDETYARKYIARGWAEEVDEAAERRATAQAEQAAKLAARGEVEIPDKFADLPSPDLFALANKFADGKVRDRQTAVAAVQAEIDRRAAASKA